MTKRFHMTTNFNIADRERGKKPHMVIREPAGIMKNLT